MLQKLGVQHYKARNGLYLSCLRLVNSHPGAIRVNHPKGGAFKSFKVICTILKVGLPARAKHCITKTCPCNEYPRIPHYYIAKQGYAGVYLFFLFLLQNIDCGYTIYVLSKNKKNIENFLLKIFIFLQF